MIIIILSLHFIGWKEALTIPLIHYSYCIKDQNYKLKTQQKDYI